MTTTPEEDLTPGEQMALAALALATLTDSQVSQVLESPLAPVRATAAILWLVTGAVSQAAALGASWASVEWNTDVDPRPISPAKTAQLAQGVDTCLALPDPAPTLSTLVRSEVVRSAADTFTSVSVEAVEADEEFEWELVLTPDADPCPRCVAAAGRIYPNDESFSGVHPNCGCFLSIERKRK